MTNEQIAKITEVVEEETAYLEHLIRFKYSFLFETKYKLGNGEIHCPGEDFKNKLTAVINRLNAAIEQQ